MFLHISGDEKFLDPFFIPNATEFLNVKNKYVIYSDKVELEYVKSPLVEYAKYDSNEFWSIIGDLNRFEVIFIHYLSDITLDFILKCPSSKKIVWIYWGADGYKIDFLYNKILGPEELKLFKKQNQKFLSGAKSLVGLLRYNYGLMNKKRFIKQVFSRIDYFAHYVFEEYQFLKSYYGFEAEYLEFNYGTVDQILNGSFNIRKNIEGKPKYIILGNNGALTNNCLEVLDGLGDSVLTNYNVFCPLSYSINRAYVEEVIWVGRAVLGDRFIPITKFMERDRYNQLVGGSSLIIQNQYRSQGGATIWGALYHGIPLMMNKKNALYRLFKEVGMDILSLEELRGGSNKLEDILENIDHATNKRLLLKYYGALAVKSRYENLNNLL